MPLRSITEKCVVSSGSCASARGDDVLAELERCSRPCAGSIDAATSRACSFEVSLRDRHRRRSRDRRGGARDRDRRGASPRSARCSAGGVSRPFDFEIERLEDVEHLDQRDAAGARRRHRDDLVAAVGAAYRRALLGLVGGEILLRDQPAVGLHVLGDAIGDPALVEGVGAVGGDRAQRLAEIARARGDRPRPTRRRPACRTRRPTRETAPSRPAARGSGCARARPTSGSPLGQRDAGHDDVLPRQLAELLVRELEAAHGAGHARREVAGRRQRCDRSCRRRPGTSSASTCSGAFSR